MSTGRVTVVLASLRSRKIAEASLAALAPQCAREGVHLIVARRATEVDEDWLLERFPECQLILCEGTAGVPEIRGAGLQAATGDWVLLTEDNCLAADDWIVQMRERMSSDVAVIGGTMGNAATARSIDWGAFFAEYGFFGAAEREGTGTAATGANVGYRGDVVNSVAEWSLAGSWEDVIHNRLTEAGVPIVHASEAVVRQQLSYGLWSFMFDRFVHGRDYARVRSRSLPLPRRLLLALASPALPIVLASRIWKSTGRYNHRPFLRALPATLTFLSAWATGEIVGYLHGSDSNA